MSSQKMRRQFPIFYTALIESELIAGERSEVFSEIYNEIAPSPQTREKAADSAHTMCKAFSPSPMSYTLSALSDSFDTICTVYTTAIDDSAH